jgi:hypothetical protein
VRLWSIHPKYLDAKGLVACWKEALEAQDYIWGDRKGGRHENHPALNRFHWHQNPKHAISGYLAAILEEAAERGFNYNASLIRYPLGRCQRIYVSTAQLSFERQHLKKKLEERNQTEKLNQLLHKGLPAQHPLFLRLYEPVSFPWELGIDGTNGHGQLEPRRPHW